MAHFAVNLLVAFLGVNLVVGDTDTFEVRLKVEGTDGVNKHRICTPGYQHYTELDTSMADLGCTYIDKTCRNIGQRSELFVICDSEVGDDDIGTVTFDGDVNRNGSSVTVTYTLTLLPKSEVECQGILEWDSANQKCGCFLDNFEKSLHTEYVGNNATEVVSYGTNIQLRCIGETYFEDYTTERNITCDSHTDLASFSCNTAEEYKSFDNKVAHFEGTLDSYVIVDNPFSQVLTELAVCFWLRTKDAVGSIISLANEDHWNALRFDTHTSHIHFTVAGLHTDHGLVPKIVLKDDLWRYFCANWQSETGEAKVFLRKKGSASPDDTEEFSEILPLSIGKTVRATGGKLALGNLWREDVVDMGFNPVGSLEGDVMGLNLFNTTVNKTTFNSMFEGCSTKLDIKNVVISWKELLGRGNDVSVAATFGQQVCSKGYKYGEKALEFPYSNEQFLLSNYVQNYAKIENAFSIDLTAFTICTIIKTKIKIGTIFSYVTTVNGFVEQIVLEKHKTHMHFYMAGVDQQVGAVPAVPIDTTRWYTTCFSWQNDGTWRGYLDGDEVTNNQTKKLEHTVGRTIAGGGTCYLGILKTFNSFREYRGYGGEITELNLWGKALTPQEIKHMVKSNKVHEDDLLVNWGTLLEKKRGNMTVDMIALCPSPPPVQSGDFSKTNGSSHSALYELEDTIVFRCNGATVLKDQASNEKKTCTKITERSYEWRPANDVVCQGCEDAEMFECPAEKCIPMSQVCDGTDDCSDGSDEMRCSSQESYWIVIGVLIALLVLLVPAVFLVKKARAARAEIARVKKLTDDWEIKREHLELQNKLGEGAFGKVFKGLLLTKPNYDTPVEVAVKELSDIATERDKNMFLEEIRLSKKLGNHPNIVGIVGAIICYEPASLILEFVDGGDLLEYLQKNKENPQCDLTQEDQVFFSWQIANGMEYVSGKNFVHRDLAARNVLVSTQKQCKVTDFGLARDLYNYDEYQSEGGRLPIKWMSPEAIFELKFTTESDVWSYGVLMYELFSWGGSPYPGIDPSLLRDRLINGFRMAAPNNTPDFIYSLMLQAWEFKSADRPSFTEIRTFIEGQINHYTPFIKFKEKISGEYINMDPSVSLENTAQPEDQEQGFTGTEEQGSPAPSRPLQAQLPATNGDHDISRADPVPGEAYKNLAFKGTDVVYKNDYKHVSAGDQVAAAAEPAVGTKKKTEYTKVEVVRRPSGPEEGASTSGVNVGFADDKGMVEISRSDYMNT